jgi:hypothetical protein
MKISTQNVENQRSETGFCEKEIIQNVRTHQAGSREGPDKTPF